jgi:hypothetical protein
MSKRRCSECEYWVYLPEDWRLHRDDRPGKCRRYPPVLDTAHLQEVDTSLGGSEARSEAWQQPLTTGGDWCGEFSPDKSTISRAREAEWGLSA